MKGIFALLALVASVQGSNWGIYKDSRVVGGQLAKPYSIPYQLSIKNYGLHFCGGSIYDESTVLTAAHCCPLVNSATRVVAAEHHQFIPSKNEQPRKVIKVMAHSEFATTGINNDICILKLEKPFEFNDKVSAVKMPKQGQKFEGKAVVSGWGSRVEGFPGSMLLYYAELTMMKRENCHQLLGDNFDETMVCANGVDEFKGSCHGDSGGPLVCEEGVQCGIVSWGYKCGKPETPGVYANLSYFIDWIKEQLSA